MSVMIGTPALGAPTWGFLETLLALKAPDGYRFVRRGPLAVDVARNDLVRTFLAAGSDYSHLLMVDSDALLHPRTLERLLSWDVPVVAALAFMRYGPLYPTVYRDPQEGVPGSFRVRIDEVHNFAERHRELISSKPVVLDPRPPDALFEVDRSGCHCVLIRRDVLETMKEPWFVAEPIQHNKEDFYFYEQVQAAGFRAYVDFSCMTAHLYGDRPLAALDHFVWDASSDYASTTTTPKGD